MIGRLLLVLHVVAAVGFVGNIATGLFWAIRARHTRDTRVLRHTFLSLNAADGWITAPTVIVITVTGIAAAVRMGLPLLGTGWILWSVVAFSLSGLAFAVRVLPLQRRLAGAFGDADQTTASHEQSTLIARWSHWAHLSLLFAIVALLLMILKPDLPALGR